MKISIITATFNSSPHIAHCLESVNKQTHPDIEHIIVDGASNDNTLDIINATPSRVEKIVSEPDNGIYDAMNKGIKLATGDIVGILNSDDFYATNTIIERVANTFLEKKTESVYGNLDFVAAKNTSKIIRQWKSTPYVKGSFRKGWHPPHPTFFVRREVYEKLGSFDVSFNVSADFELMLRFFEKGKITSHYIDDTFVIMRYGGESTGSIKKILLGNRNIIKAFKKNGIDVGSFYTLKRLGNKALQFIKRKK